MNAELLKKLIAYDHLTGDMFWLRRNESHFKSDWSMRSWNTKYAGKLLNTVDGKGYLCASIFGQRYTLHRLAWLHYYGSLPTVIDHIDGNRKNNRIANLRDVSVQDNHLNLRKANNNTSGVTGVYLNKSRSLWCAQMKFNGKTYHLGSSKNFDDAVQMRKKEEKLLGFSERHGQC